MPIKIPNDLPARSVLEAEGVMVMLEAQLDRRVPQPFRLHAHHWLILHGRYTCKARKPLCEACVVADLCEWPEKTVPA